MQEISLVTGGGTGLGRELSLDLARHGHSVLVIGRRPEPLEQTRAQAPSQIEVLQADVATEQGRAEVVRAVGERRVRFLVHNAAVLAPVGPLAQVELEAWRYAMTVNLEAPIFLTQALLPRLKAGRVLHVSTGAAHSPLAGWGAYCVSKAALYMAYRVWREELAGSGVLIGSLRPGVVDTPMQAYIREQDETRFPLVKRFRQLKSEGQLRSPQEVASFASWVLRKTDAHEFVEEEWEVGNARHTARWQYR